MSFVPKNKVCPICDSNWKVTSFGNNKWYDCVKCNMKAEDLDKETKHVSKKYSDMGYPKTDDDEDFVTYTTPWSSFGS